MNKQIKDRPPVRVRLIRDGWTLLSRRRKMIAIGIAVCFVFSSGLEMLALSSAAPFVSLLVDTEFVHRNKLLAHLYQLLGTPPLEDLVRLLGVAVCILLIAGTLARLGSYYLVERFARGSTAALSRQLIMTSLKAPYTWHLRQNSTALAQKILNDSQEFGYRLFPILLELLYAAFLLFFGLLAIVFASSPKIFLALLVLGLVTLLFVLASRPYTARYSGEARTHLIYGVQKSVETLSATKDIKVKAKEHFFTELVVSRIERSLGNKLRLSMIQRALPMGLLLIGQLALIVIGFTLYTIGLDAADLTAQMALLVLMSSRLLPAISGMSGYINRLESVKPAIRGILDVQAEIATTQQKKVLLSGHEKVPADWQCLCLENVSYSYLANGPKAINHINMSVRRGQSIGVIGASGAGKSTLIDLILGLLQPNFGQITIDGIDLNQINKVDWFKHIGYVPQDPVLLDDTLRRNVAFGLRDGVTDDVRVWKCLEIAGLKDFCQSLDEGLDTQVGERGSRISGGQKQRIAIARALYDSPDILILDEATSALDAKTENIVLETISALEGQITTITIAHRLSTVEKCDHLVVLEGGYLVKQGSFQELGHSETFG